MKARLKRMTGLVWQNPGKMMKLLLSEGTLAEASGMVGLAMVLSAAALLWSARSLSVSILLAAVCILVAAILLIWVLSSGVCYGVARIFGGKGAFKDLLMLYGYIAVWDCLCILLEVVGHDFPWTNQMVLVLRFWELLLNLAAIHAAMKLSAFRSVLVLLVPLLLLAGGIFVLMLWGMQALTGV